MHRTALNAMQCNTLHALQCTEYNAMPCPGKTVRSLSSLSSLHPLRGPAGAGSGLDVRVYSLSLSFSRSMIAQVFNLSTSPRRGAHFEEIRSPMSGPSPPPLSRPLQTSILRSPGPPFWGSGNPLFKKKRSSKSCILLSSPLSSSSHLSSLLSMQ